MDAIKRKKIIITILIAVIVVVALIIAFKLTDYGKNPDQNTDNQLPEFTAPSAKLEYKEIPPTVSDSELAATQVAMNFAERFGTYSSDLPGENINQLMSLCTKKMSNYLQQIEIDYQSPDFKGVTTKSVSSKVSDISDSQAEVIVSTQRQESSTIGGKLVSNLTYQDIKINLLKSDKQWLVDAAYWQ